jgi:hypothetical protein
MEVVSTWRDLSPPGRFLRKDEETGRWNDIGDDDAAIKCSHVLREQKDKNCKKAKAENEEATVERKRLEGVRIIDT